MIIQRVIKGISGIDEAAARRMLAAGIVCNWWRKINPLPSHEIPMRLTQRNLEWHQNHYSEPDPFEGNETFGRHTPFISTTAGTIERNTFTETNVMHSAWEEALRFATDSWTSDGCLFYCYLLIIGKPAVEYQAFAEELRELNVHPIFSSNQPEGEITAKIVIPPAQIERAELWSLTDVQDALSNGQLPTLDPSRVIANPYFVSSEKYNNVRDFLI